MKCKCRGPSTPLRISWGQPWNGSPWWHCHSSGVLGCEAGPTWLQSPPMRTVAGAPALLGDPGVTKQFGIPSPSPARHPAASITCSLAPPSPHLRAGMPQGGRGGNDPSTAALPLSSHPQPAPTASGDRFAPARGHFSSIRPWQRLNGARLG